MEILPVCILRVSVILTHLLLLLWRYRLVNDVITIQSLEFSDLHVKFLLCIIEHLGDPRHQLTFLVIDFEALGGILNFVLDSRTIFLLEIKVRLSTDCDVVPVEIVTDVLSCLSVVEIISHLIFVFDRDRFCIFSGHIEHLHLRILSIGIVGSFILRVRDKLLIFWRLDRNGIPHIKCLLLLFFLPSFKSCSLTCNPNLICCGIILKSNLLLEIPLLISHIGYIRLADCMRKTSLSVIDKPVELNGIDITSSVITILIKSTSRCSGRIQMRKQHTGKKSCNRVVRNILTPHISVKDGIHKRVGSIYIGRRRTELGEFHQPASSIRIVRIDRHLKHPVRYRPRVQCNLFGKGLPVIGIEVLSVVIITKIIIKTRGSWISSHHKLRILVPSIPVLITAILPCFDSRLEPFYISCIASLRR